MTDSEEFVPNAELIYALPVWGIIWFNWWSGSCFLAPEEPRIPWLMETSSPHSTGQTISPWESIKNGRFQNDSSDLTEQVLSLAGFGFGHVTEISTIHLNILKILAGSATLPFCWKFTYFSQLLGSQSQKVAFPQQVTHWSANPDLLNVTRRTSIQFVSETLE